MSISDLTPWQLWTLVSCGGLCVTLACLAAGGRGEVDDGSRDESPASSSSPIPLFDRDGYLVELLTTTPYRHGDDDHAEPHCDGARPRRAHPAE